MSKNSAIMKFGEMLTHAANFSAVGAAGPSFAWASPNDIVILGKTPDDINGRVCLVSLPDDEKRRFVRLYRHGNTIKTYYMDDYDCSGEYPANGVEVHGEVLAIVHQYGVEPEAPQSIHGVGKACEKGIEGPFYLIQGSGANFETAHQRRTLDNPKRVLLSGRRGREKGGHER
mgnify:CR=1 FL=1